MAIPDYNPPDYTTHTNRPAYVAPTLNVDYPTATFTYDYEVPPVEQVWAENDHYRWSPESRDERGDLEVPQRYGVEEMISDPDHFPQAVEEPQNMGPDPKWNPPPVHSGVSTPSVWRFFRPFGQQVEHRFTGEHFSMASHTRNYPIYGMQEWHERRNTYRMEPPPRDVTIQDRPPDNPSPTPDAVYVNPNPDYRMFGPAESWRL